MNIDNINIQNNFTIPSFQTLSKNIQGNLFHILENDTFYFRQTDGRFRSIELVPFSGDISGTALCDYNEIRNTVFYEQEDQLSFNVSIGGGLYRNLINTIRGSNSIDFHQSDEQHAAFGKNSLLITGRQNRIDKHSSYSSILNSSNSKIEGTRFGQIVNGVDNILFGITMNENETMLIDFSGNEYIPISELFEFNGSYDQNIYNLILNGNRNRMINNICVNETLGGSSLKELFQTSYNTIFTGNDNIIGYAASFNNFMVTNNCVAGLIDTSGLNPNDVSLSYCNNLMIANNLSIGGFLNNIFYSQTIERTNIFLAYSNLYIHTSNGIQSGFDKSQFLNIYINQSNNHSIKGAFNSVYLNTINTEFSDKNSYNVSFIDNIIRNSSYNILFKNNRLERFQENEFRGCNVLGYNAYLLDDCQYSNAFYNKQLSILENSTYCQQFIVDNFRIENSSYSNGLLVQNSNILNSTYSTVYNSNESSIRNSIHCDVFHGSNHTIQNSNMCDIFNGTQNQILNSNHCTILNGHNCILNNKTNSSVLIGRDVEIDRNNQVYTQHVDVYGSIIYTSTNFIEKTSSDNIIIEVEDYEYIINANSNGGEIRLPNSSQAFDGMEIVLHIYGGSSATPIFIVTPSDTTIQLLNTSVSTFPVLPGNDTYYRFVYYDTIWYLFQ